MIKNKKRIEDISKEQNIINNSFTSYCTYCMKEVQAITIGLDIKSIDKDCNEVIIKGKCLLCGNKITHVNVIATK